MDRLNIKKRLTFWYGIFWILFIIALFLAYKEYLLDFTSTKSKWIGLFAGAISILLASLKMLEKTFYNTKNELKDKIAKYFSNGATHFIKRLFKTALVFIFLISCILIKPMGAKFIASFITGNIVLFICIVLKTLTTSKTIVDSLNITNNQCVSNKKEIFDTSIILSNMTLGIALIPLVILYHIIKDYQILNGYALGCAFMTLIFNISTIITKQALNNANSVICEYVAQIETNDKRNPLLLLKGITNNILDNILFSCDITFAFIAVLIATMTIGGEYLMLMGAFLPIILAGGGLFAGVIISLIINIDKTANTTKTLSNAVIMANIIFIVISFYVIKSWYPDLMYLMAPIIIGTFSGYISCLINSNYIFSKYKPILNIANCSISGYETICKQTFRECFGGIIFCALFIAIMIIVPFLSCYGLKEPSYGVYGILLAALSALSNAGIIITINTFSLITKNKNNILETYEENIQVSDIENKEIDNLNSNIIQLSNNYTNFTSIITTISVIIAYSTLIKLEEADILNPYVMGALIIGAAIPFTYSGLIMSIISKTARRLVLEVKRQFKKFPQILRFEMRPDYEKCAEISALNSSMQVIFNTGIILIIFALITIFLKIEALLGFIFGATICSIGLIYLTSLSSNVSSNVKKHFEKQFENSQDTQEYKAIELNNNLLGSFKDIINPSLCLLIKFLAILMLCLIPLFG